MTELDPGHEYLLDSLDGEFLQVIRFVKREGTGYPGNVGHYSGATMQEVLRACIRRALYVNNQTPSWLTRLGIFGMRFTIWCFEKRAANRHDRKFGIIPIDIENEPKCRICGHIRCKGDCRWEPSVTMR